MKTTLEFVLAVRELAGSDNKAGPLVGVSQMSFSRWRLGQSFPTDDNALKIAELLKIDQAYVLAIIRRDRADSDEARSAWQRIAETFAKAAGIAVLAIGGVSAPPPAQAVALGAVAADHSGIMLNRKRRRQGAKNALSAFADVAARTLGLERPRTA